MRTFSPLGAALLAALAVAAMSTAPTLAADSLKVAQLGSHTHIHGLAVDRQDPQQLLIATHHGLFRAGPDGKAERISVVQDFMGFNPHPSDPNTLYASGHPAEGGNLGFIASTDGGATWEQLSPGVHGPVDFHQMTVSQTDPQRIYGAYHDLQVSNDGGKNWKVVGPLPERLIDLAASAQDKDMVYAATEAGLWRSQDGGGTWQPLMEGAPVAMAEVMPDGMLYAFVLGRGLVRSAEDPIEFQTVSSDWGEQYVLHLAADPTNLDRMFAATQEANVLASSDRGATWTLFGD
jgi:photosystem II stability/assembly factor-like uncharacterized protein